MSVSPSRRCAFTVLRRVLEQDAYADRALHAESAELSGRDRALATNLVYGTVQRQRTLDHILGRLVNRPLEKLDPPVLIALRLGTYQLTMLGGVSDYAAVNESVELVKASSRGGAQFVNAVLRRVTREGAGILAALSDETPEDAAVLHSVPDWLAQMWWTELGPQGARGLLKQINLPAENALRVNTLKITAEEALAALPLAAEAQPAPTLAQHPHAPELPEGLVLSGPFDVFGSPQWERGEVMPQSRASMLVARTLAPQPGERVLDLCAAPGGKTTHLAALMGDEGSLTAIEVHPGRARALKQTCERMGAKVDVITADARTFRDEAGFDRVLIDPPCSGLGTLQSRPDLRWQPRRGQLAQLAAQQSELLDTAAANLKPKGALVYSVCTITRAEGDGVVDAFLERHQDFECGSRMQLLPSVDGTDGFFIARLSRT